VVEEPFPLYIVDRVEREKGRKFKMWAVISNGKIIKTLSNPRALTLNNVQYPKSIFSSSWTDQERKAVGILPYTYEGSYINNMFYSNSESSPVIAEDRVVVTRTKSSRDISKIKDTMKNHINSVLSGYLSQTDWTIIRKIDIGKEPPTDLAQWRTDLRAKAVELEGLVDSKTTVEELEKISLHKWPRNPREE
tara:strand:- start:289 stop:864 length:576 start_codon:yes stop_codon:yes gene_type:complete